MKKVLFFVCLLLIGGVASAQVREAGIYALQGADTTCIRPVQVSFNNDDDFHSSSSYSVSFFRRRMKLKSTTTPEFLFVYDYTAKTNNLFRVNELKSEDALTPQHAELYPVETLFKVVKYADLANAPIGTAQTDASVQILWEQLDDTTYRVRFDRPLPKGEYILTFDVYASKSSFAHFYVWPFKVVE